MSAHHRSHHIARGLFGRLYLFALMLGALLFAAADARADVLKDQARARASAVTRLVELGDWCQENHLFARRADVARQILVFAPGHSQAHRWLRHRLKTAKEWVPPRTPYTPHDRDPSALENYPAQRLALLKPVLKQFEEVVATHRVRARPAQLLRVNLDLVVLAPENSAYRKRVGETRVDDGWVLIETARARKQRPALRTKLKELERKTAKTSRTELTPTEGRYDIPWTGQLKCGDARVLGTVKPVELEESAQLANLAARMFRSTFGNDARLGEGFTVYLFADRETPQTLLRLHPHVSALEQTQALGAAGHAISFSYDLLVHHATRRVRSTQAVRQTFSTLLRDTYALKDDPGWLRDGLSMRLTEELVGSTLTWHGNPKIYGAAESVLASRLFSSGADWRRMARDYVAKNGVPDLSRLQSLSRAAMKPSDVLLAHAFASFLLEGRPDDLKKFLVQVRGGAPPDWALRRITALDDELLAIRLHRWLGEMAPKDDRTPSEDVTELK